MSHFFIDFPADNDDRKVGECEHCGKIAELATTEILGGFEGDEQELCKVCCQEGSYCWSCGQYTTEADGGFSENGLYCIDCDPAN